MEEKEFLPPLPYDDGVEYRYVWVHAGVEFATTVLTVTTVKEADAPVRIRARGRLDYERQGRVLIGSSDATFEGDVGHPIRYENRLSAGVPNLGEVETTLAARFEEGIARISRKEGVPQLRTSEVAVETPTYLLDDQCFEHWALVAPYFRRFQESGKLPLFVPHGEHVLEFILRHERTEGSGKARRERWSVEHPSMQARVWTDARGRLVEYVQGEVRIFLASPPPTASDDEKDGSDEEAGSPNPGDADRGDSDGR